MFSITTLMSSSYFYDDCDDSTSIMQSSEGLSFIKALNELVINSNSDDFNRHRNALDAFYGGDGGQENAEKALAWLYENAQQDENFNTVVNIIQNKLQEQMRSSNIQHTNQNSNQFGDTGSKKYTTEIEVINPTSTAIQTVETRSQEGPQIVKLNIFEQSVEANKIVFDILLRDGQPIHNYDLQSIIAFLISPTGNCGSNRIFSNFLSIQNYDNTEISLYDRDIDQIAFAIHKTFGYRAEDQLVNLKNLILSLSYRNKQDSSIGELIKAFEEFISAIQNDCIIEMTKYLSVQQQIQKCLSTEIQYLLATFMKEIEDLINGYNSFHTVNRVTWINSAPTQNTINYPQVIRMQSPIFKQHEYGSESRVEETENYNINNINNNQLNNDMQQEPYETKTFNDEQKQEPNPMDLIEQILGDGCNLSHGDGELELLFSSAIKQETDSAKKSKAESILSVVRDVAGKLEKYEIVRSIDKLFDKIANSSDNFDQTVIGEILTFINEHIINTESTTEVFSF